MVALRKMLFTLKMQNMARGSALSVRKPQILMLNVDGQSTGSARLRSSKEKMSVLAEGAASGTPRQRECLLGYLEAEGASRDASKRAQLLRRCALPQAKSLDGYDWSSVSWPEGFGRADLEELSFVGPCEDLVLMGDVGTGKTHLACALAAMCCARGW